MAHFPSMAARCCDRVHRTCSALLTDLSMEGVGGSGGPIATAHGSGSGPGIPPSMLEVGSLLGTAPDVVDRYTDDRSRGDPPEGTQPVAPTDGTGPG